MGNKKIRGLLIGAVLGDAHINKKGYLYIGHGEKQKDYVNYKIKLLSSYFEIKTFEKYIYDSRYNKKYKQIGFYTNVKPILHNLRDKMYDQNGIKRIRRKDLDDLNELGLTLWYLDDGCLSFKKKDGKIHGRQLIINTQNFNYNEHLIMKYWFKDRYGIDVKIQRDRDKYRLWMNGKNANKFLSIINTYIPECMYYKLCMRYGTKKQELNLCKRECSKDCPFKII
jgi:LAGLIDADG DNA endonuclease family